MRIVFRVACATSLAMAVVSCGLLKKKGGEAADAAPEASVAEVPDSAPAPTPPGPLASNEDDIVRFPDETKLDNVASTVQRWANVREAPMTGKVVTSLNKGASVTQIAQREKYVLVVFDNPKSAGKKLMGWIVQDSFSPAPPQDAGVKPLTCPTGEMPLFSDGPFCGKVCERDADCPAGQACKGSASKLKNGKAGDAVTVCTVFHAPSAPKTDGGTVVPPLTTLLDAGLLKLDAGTLPTPPAPGAPTSDVLDPTGGQCPTGYQLVAKDKKCHKLCPNFDCRKETRNCINCGGAKVCSADRDLCK